MILTVAVGAPDGVGSAFGAAEWSLATSSGSTRQRVPTAVSNLTISAVATPSASNHLHPGPDGDVVLTIHNPNRSTVTTTVVNLLTNTTYASGYTTGALSTAQTSCAPSTSDVIWNVSTATGGSARTLTTPLVVGAHASSSKPGSPNSCGSHSRHLRRASRPMDSVP
jgi:hypothetical protein